MSKILLYSSFLLFQLPPFYFLIQQINTHTFGKFLILLAFVYHVFFIKRIKSQFLSSWEFKIFAVIIIFQALSIVNSIDIFLFISRFQNIFFSFLYVIIFASLKINDKTIIYILIVGLLSNLLFQTFLYIYPYSIHILSYFIGQNYMDLISMNLDRGRIYFENYDEILLPFLLYFFINSKIHRLKRVYFLGLCFGIFLFSIASGFRTKILMALFGLFPISIYVFKKNWHSVITFFVLTGVILISLFQINGIFLNNRNSYTSGPVERLFSNFDNPNSYSTGRINTWMKAIELGISNPIGIGLGNFIFYNHGKKIPAQMPGLNPSEFSIGDPHGFFFTIFAEAGVVVLVLYLILIISFISKDIKLICQTSFSRVIPYIIAFWILFFYSLLNPSWSIKYLTLFWTLRIIIEQINFRKMS